MNDPLLRNQTQGDATTSAMRIDWLRELRDLQRDMLHKAKLGLVVSPWLIQRIEELNNLLGIHEGTWGMSPEEAIMVGLI